MVPANTHTDFLEEFAAFGEASYDLTQTLELTAGVRVSNLKQHFTNTNTGTDDTPVSPKLVLSWRPLDRLLLYARYGTGFRPGNVNNNLEFYAGQFEQSIQDVMNSTGLDEATRQQRIAGLREMIANSRSRLFFDGDTLDSYELGAKSALWDGRMALLASAYYIDWKDMLVYVADPAIARGGDIHNANSGGAQIRGFELEVTAFVTERFNVRLAGDVNDTEVTESAAFSRSGDGAELIYAPNYSASVALDYSLPIAGGWTIDFHVDRAWVAEQFSNAQNTLEIPSYERSNGRVTLRSPGGPDGSKWRVALYGTNLENEEILRGRTEIGTLYWHSPRQLGVEVGYRRCRPAATQEGRRRIAMQAATIANPCLDELSRLQLERNALELNVCGYTVIENAIDPELTARGLEATLRTFEARNGKGPNVQTGEGYEGYWTSHFVLLRDPAFEQILMAEKVLALVDYLLGEDCILSSSTSLMRGKGGGAMLPSGYLRLHGDDVSPQPHPNYCNHASVNFYLTDVREDSGCLAVVPGSHKRLRQPTAQERVLAGEGANPEAVPVVAPAGSAVIWPSHTWHGSFESPTPDLRVTFALLFARPHLQPYDLYRESVSDEALARNSRRFGTLMGMDTVYGWNDNKDDWMRTWRDRDRSRYAPRAA